MNYHLIQGKIVPESEAWISPFDLGLLRGYGVFDFFKVLHGLPLFMNEHLERLNNSTRLMGLELKESKETIKAWIIELIRLNHMVNGTIKIIVTGGISEDGFKPALHSSIFILTGHIQFTLSETYQEQKPYRLKSLEYKRETPGVKSLNYIVPIQHWNSILAEGYQDILYVYRNSVSETSRANIFIVTQDDVLVTPSEDILPGVTRNHILQMAKSFIPVEIRKVTMEEVLSSKEVFLTSTTKRLMPVDQIDHHKLNSLHPGMIGHKLYSELRKLEEADKMQFQKTSMVK